MSIVHSFKFDENNANDRELNRRLQIACRQARNFFDEEANEFRIARAFQEWATFSFEQVDKLLTTLKLVAHRIEERQPHKAFPVELKKRYLVNMYAIIERFKKIRAEIQPPFEYCDHDSTYLWNGHETCLKCHTILN